MMNKLTFADLASELLDETIPLSILFDIVIEQLYGKVELDSFVSCTLEGETWNFSCNDVDNHTYTLLIGSDWSLSMFCNDIPLHFNQYPLYKKLFEWNFL
jgi:hypothetical protein